MSGKGISDTESALRMTLGMDLFRYGLGICGRGDFVGTETPDASRSLSNRRGRDCVNGVDTIGPLAHGTQDMGEEGSAHIVPHRPVCLHLTCVGLGLI